MSGWSTTTVKANDEDSAEQLRDALEDAGDDNYDRADIRDGTRVEALVWGYGGNTIALGVLRDHPDLWDEAIVMSCNDTSDSGSGSYYTSDGSSVEQEASASGYEGARGRDAAGELRGKAGFRPFMR